MIKLSGNEIYVTKGDTLDLQLTITTPDGQSYTPNPGDTIRFALKRKYSDAEPLLLKTIPTDTLRLRIESDETETLKAGPTPYVYDIELTTIDGTVDTFIDRQRLYVTEEVY